MPVAPVQPTVYTSAELAGILDWADTPATIVFALSSAGSDQRPDEAARFLGRVPAGGWAADYEGTAVQDGRERMMFRGVEENAAGLRPLIALEPKAPGATPEIGQRVMVTGRLAEICVDDPAEPAGRLLLDEATFR